MITAGALGSLLVGWDDLRRGLRSLKGLAGTAAPGGEEASTTVPRWWWLGGLVLATVGAAITARVAFGVAIWQSLVAVAIGIPITVICMRAAAETNFSPANNISKVMPLIFAGLAPGQAIPGVVAAGVTAGSATEAGEAISDLKSGTVLANRPRHLFVAQLIGILVAAGAAVGTYLLIVSMKPIGGAELTAPTAVNLRMISHGLSGGVALPKGAALATWIAAGVGLALVLASTRWKRLPLPSPVAMGLGAIFLARHSAMMLVGALLAWVLGKVAARWWEERSAIAPSGLILGAAVVELVVLGVAFAGVLKLK
jgi:uncharacterized oligopeptide transporter (OPT) family protein